MWESAYAISVGLLNDQDVNKADNIGVVKDRDSSRLSLFDLGHTTPNKFELDSQTLLPKSTSRFADFLLSIIDLFVSAGNLPQTFTMIPDIRDQLCPDERAEVLQMVIDEGPEVLQEVKRMKEAFGKDKEDKSIKNTMLKLREQTEERIQYLMQTIKQYNEHKNLNLSFFA